MKLRKALVIPDTQVRPGISLEHFKWIGRFIAEKRPDVIINLGDTWEFDSLSEYDRESKVKEFHQRSYANDLLSGTEAMNLLNAEIAKVKDYRPRKEWTEGNHDYRVERLLDRDPRLRGSFDTPRTVMKRLGWKVNEYLTPVTIDGVTYCHLFVKSSNGLVTSTKFGAPNARAMVQREMRSVTCGHKPGLDTHIQSVGNRQIRGIIAGSCYRHDLDYSTPQGNRHWRGILVKHEVHEGDYSLMEISLDFLKRKYS